MAKIGRNAPCPCGSGKKYKKCCLNKKSPEIVEKVDELNDLMQQGYVLLEKNQFSKACDVWLEFWDKLKVRFKPDFVDVTETDNVFSGFQSVYNWCQDLEAELGNAGTKNESYYQQRIDYCSEFCQLFPESDSLLMHNMKRAIAESHFALDEYEQGDKLFEALVDEYPDNIWGYIGWGDMYFLCMNKNQKPDYKKAQEIYNLALGKDLKDESDLVERLEDLKNQKDKKSE